MNFIPSAVLHLKKSDPVLRRLIVRAGPCGLPLEREANQFGALVDAIIYQQLAYKAAQTIATRFRALFARPGGNPRGRLPRPEELLRTSRSKLRAAGLSRQKIGYLRDLAAQASRGALKLGRFAKTPDEGVIENLTQVKGIGRWTAEMFLIFSLGRPDVLPVGDLGLQYGIKEVYGLRALPSARKIEGMAEPWRPYRSVATWYLWKARRMRVEAGD